MLVKSSLKCEQSFNMISLLKEGKFMYNKKVSVIIPTYNCEQWIEQSIDSVINQTYTNIEIIVVNDGSTDNTIDRLNNYKDDNRINLYTIENSGPAFARNFGVSKSSGELIAFLDADDYWDPDKVKKQVEYFEMKKCSLLLTNIVIVDENNDIIDKVEKNIPSSKQQQTIDFFLGKITQNTPTILVSRKVFDEVGGFNTELIHREDHYFLMQVANLYGINLIDEFLVYRRKWEDSMSSDYNKVERNSTTIINHFKKTRYPFLNISINTFPYLQDYYSEATSKYHYQLSHILLKNYLTSESREQLKISFKYYKTKKKLIKLFILYLPSFIRKPLLRFIYQNKYIENRS